MGGLGRNHNSQGKVLSLENQKDTQFCSRMLKEKQGHPGEPLPPPTWLLAVFSVDKVQLNLNTLGRREVGSSISDVLQVALKAFFTVCHVFSSSTLLFLIRKRLAAFHHKSTISQGGSWVLNGSRSNRHYLLDCS